MKRFLLLPALVALVVITGQAQPPEAQHVAAGPAVQPPGISYKDFRLRIDGIMMSQAHVVKQESEGNYFYTGTGIRKSWLTRSADLATGFITEYGMGLYPFQPNGLMPIMGYGEIGLEGRISNLYGLANAGMQLDIWELVHGRPDPVIYGRIATGYHLPINSTYGVEFEVGVLPFLRTLDATLYGGMSITFR